MQVFPGTNGAQATARVTVEIDGSARPACAAIQVHGAGGVSQDFPLAAAFAGIRTLRLADGPDEVHKNALARTELKRQRARREGTR